MVLLYHLTDKINFRLDPRYAPTRNTTMGGEMRPGIFLSDHPDTWAQMYGYWQPWIVEFDVPEGVGNNGGGYGGEVYVLATDYPKMRLVRVVALDAWCRENFQDWGWTETEYGTEFDTEKPLPPGNWHMSGYGQFPYHGYRAPDARQSDQSWQTRYKTRVKKYQRSHRVAAKTAAQMPGPFWHGTTANLQVGDFLEAAETLGLDRANARSSHVTYHSVFGEEDQIASGDSVVWVTTNRSDAESWAFGAAENYPGQDVPVYLYRVTLPDPDSGIEDIGPVLDSTTADEWVAPYATIVEKIVLSPGKTAAKQAAAKDWGPVRQHAASLGRDKAKQLWLATALNGAGGRARAAQERAARKVLDQAFGDLHDATYPVQRYHEILEEVAWPGQTEAKTAAAEEPYLHASDVLFEPGDIVYPAAQVGGSRYWSPGVTNAYDPDSVYMYRASEVEKRFAGPGRFGSALYEVEPLGPVLPDQENSAGSKGCYRTTKARVVRMVYNHWRPDVPAIPAPEFVPDPQPRAKRLGASRSNRRCEQCGSAMPNRMHRQTNEQGRKVCEECKRMSLPAWGTSHSSLDLVAQSEMRRREAEAIVSISKVRRLRTQAHDSGDNAILNHCFAGETEYLTRDGVKTLAETVGTRQWVMTGGAEAHGGRWVETVIHEFGEQPLLRVTLRRNKQTKVIRATPEHRWLLTAGPQRDRLRRVTTSELRSGQRLPHLRLPVTTVDPSRDGIRMGFLFGDGTIARYAGRAYGNVSLYGPKRDLAKYFDEIVTTSAIEVMTDNGVPGLRYSSGMAGYHKDLPALTESPEYLLGWLMGYFAADGSVSSGQGQCSLSSSSMETLLHVRDVATVLGIGTYAPTTKMRQGYGDEPTVLHQMGFSATDLGEWFFLRDDQRQAARTPQHERFGWTVVSVEDQGEIGIVYCPRVPETESFVLVDNVHTGQCPFCGSGAIVAGSDGSVTCDFCHSAFTVQVQPQHPSMPQTVDGQPVTPPGMPGGQETELSAPTDPAVEESQDGVAANPLDDTQGPPSNGPVAPGQPPSKQPQAPGQADPQSNPGKGADGKKPNPFAKDPKSDSAPKGKSQPPWLKKKTFRTASGETLSEQAYLAHLALEHADDRLAVLDTVRTANLTKQAAEACPACGGRGYHDVGGTTIDNPPDTEDCTLCEGAGTVSHLTAEEYRRATEHQGSMRPFERQAATGLTRHQVPAHQVQVGDYLDSGGKVRVHNTHLRNDQVLLAWRLKGSKAPGIRQHHKDETVNVWRRTTEA